MKRRKIFQPLLALALGIAFALSAQAAPKLDAQLGSRLRAAKGLQTSSA